MQLSQLDGICDAPTKEGAVDLLLGHGEEQPCDMLRILRLALEVTATVMAFGS